MREFEISDFNEQGNRKLLASVAGQSSIRPIVCQVVMYSKSGPAARLPPDVGQRFSTAGVAQTVSCGCNSHEDSGDDPTLSPFGDGG